MGAGRAGGTGQAGKGRAQGACLQALAPVGWQVGVGHHKGLQMKAPIGHKEKSIVFPWDARRCAAQHLARR